MTIRPFHRSAFRVPLDTHLAGGLRLIAVVCFGLFACSVILMPAIEEGYDPVRRSISEGVLYPRGYIQTGGIALLAVGAFALAGGMCRSCGDRLNYGIAALVACSAIFMMVLAVFPTDPQEGPRSLAGRIHSYGATAACAAIVAAMLCASIPPGRRPGYAKLLLPLLLLTIGVCMMFDIGPRGVVQRIGATFAVGWLSSLALAGYLPLTSLQKRVRGPVDRTEA